MGDNLNSLLNLLKTPQKPLKPDPFLEGNAYNFRDRWAPADNAMINGQFQSVDRTLNPAPTDPGFFSNTRMVSKLAPEGLPWQSWHKSNNVEYAPGATFGPDQNFNAGVNLLKKEIPSAQINILGNLLGK